MKTLTKIYNHLLIFCILYTFYYCVYSFVSCSLINPFYWIINLSDYSDLERVGFLMAFIVTNIFTFFINYVKKYK